MKKEIASSLECLLFSFWDTVQSRYSFNRSPNSPSTLLGHFVAKVSTCFVGFSFAYSEYFRLRHIPRFSSNGTVVRVLETCECCKHPSWCVSHHSLGHVNLSVLELLSLSNAHALSLVASQTLANTQWKCFNPTASSVTLAFTLCNWHK